MGHLHLVLNHFPIAGISFCLAFLMFGFVKNNDVVKVVALWMFVATAVLGLGAYFTGEPAEDLAKHLPGVTKAIIEKHEDAATVSLVFIELVGVLSLAALFLHNKTKTLNAKLVMGVCALSAVAMVTVGYAANLGGQVRHTEVRADYVPPAEPVGGEEAPEK